MYLKEYELKEENYKLKYNYGNGLFDSMGYSGYQKRGDGHGISKNYRIGEGDVIRTTHNDSLIFKYEN